MPVPSYNGGFGLNYNSGFGSRMGPVGSTGALEGMANQTRLIEQLGQGRQRRESQQSQQGHETGQLDRQLAAQSDTLARTLAQRDQESQRQFQLGQQGIGQQAIQSRLAHEAALAPVKFQRERWGQLFPYAKDMLGGLQGGYQGQGPVGAAPAIDASPIYNEQQIQQQVNASRAANDASTAGKQRDMQASLAGRGFGANSPLAMALQTAMAGQNLASNTGAERQLRFDAAGANAEHRLGAQKAQEGQYASRQQEDIERNKTLTGARNQILSLLFGF